MDFAQYVLKELQIGFPLRILRWKEIFYCISKLLESNSKLVAGDMAIALLCSPMQIPNLSPLFQHYGFARAPIGNQAVEFVGECLRPGAPLASVEFFRGLLRPGQFLLVLCFQLFEQRQN